MHLQIITYLLLTERCDIQMLKKLGFFITALAIILSLCSCSSDSPKYDPETDIKSTTFDNADHSIGEFVDGICTTSKWTVSDIGNDNYTVNVSGILKNMDYPYTPYSGTRMEMSFNIEYYEDGQFYATMTDASGKCFTAMSDFSFVSNRLYNAANGISEDTTASDLVPSSQALPGSNPEFPGYDPYKANSIGDTLQNLAFDTTGMDYSELSRPWAEAILAYWLDGENATATCYEYCLASQSGELYTLSTATANMVDQDTIDAGCSDPGD